MSAYYNEIEPAAAHVLECLVKDGVLPAGVVDRRSIADVEPSDIAEFTQAHFFAGGGMWAVAARQAGWPDDRPLWSGSCPCQPFSVAGKGKGANDERHLWPHFFRLIRACRPAVVVGEQVAGNAGYGWFDGVAADLETEGYASRAVDVPACAVDAPHIRQRLYWIAVVDADGAGQREHSGPVSIRTKQPGAQRAGGDAFDMADADRGGCGGRQETSQRGEKRRTTSERSCSDMADANGRRQHVGEERNGAPSQSGQQTSHRHNADGCSRSYWAEHEWRTGADGKTRRAKPGIRLLVDGLPGRVGLLRIGGNAIVAPLATQVIAALMETTHV